jgi:L-cysteine/cystine lyase
MTYSEARALFPMLDRLAYLNTGSAGPLATPVLEAMGAEEERAVREGRGAQATFKHTTRLREVARARLAELVGVEAGSVALTASTTDGCNIVLAGLGLGPGDEGVTTAEEHPGLILPLHTSGARVVVAQPEPEALLAAVTPRTRLLAISHVLWTTGRTLPVHELKERTGLPILVDGAQAAGAIPVDARGLDYYTISGQKWLCGPEGTGALVVADPEALRCDRPSYLSQDGYEQDGAFARKAGAARFDPNLTPAAATAGLRAAISGIPEWGHKYAFGMAETFRARLAEVGCDVVAPDDRATLVSWRVPAERSSELVTSLAEAGVIVRDLPGRGLVRASVGWWTAESDLDRLIEAL